MITQYNRYIITGISFHTLYFTEVCSAQAHIPGHKVDVELKQKFQIKKLVDSFILLDCATINSQVIFSENSDKRLLVHNINGSFIRDFKLSEQPCCISLINENSVVVTFNKSHMQIINTNTGQVQNVIKTSGDSFWVSYENKLLYATIDKKRIDVITLEGEVIRSFHSPVSPIWYIAAATNSLFLTDHLHDTLYCCNLYGSVIWKFTNEKMKRPYSVTSDGKGNAYVACALSNNVVVVSSDGKYQKEIEIQKEDGLQDPTGVHYDKAGNNLWVFNRSSGKVLVYEIKHSK